MPIQPPQFGCISPNMSLYEIVHYTEGNHYVLVLYCGMFAKIEIPY